MQRIVLTDRQTIQAGCFLAAPSATRGYKPIKAAPDLLSAKESYPVGASLLWLFFLAIQSALTTSVPKLLDAADGWLLGSFRALTFEAARLAQIARSSRKSLQRRSRRWHLNAFSRRLKISQVSRR